MRCPGPLAPWPPGPPHLCFPRLQPHTWCPMPARPRAPPAHPAADAARELAQAQPPQVLAHRRAHGHGLGPPASLHGRESRSALLGNDRRRWRPSCQLPVQEESFRLVTPLPPRRLAFLSRFPVQTWTTPSPTLRSPRCWASNAARKGSGVTAGLQQERAGLAH